MSGPDRSQACVSSGARLCTQLEVVPATQGSGCGHDELLVWVWDECNHDLGGAGAYKVAVHQGKTTACGQM